MVERVVFEPDQYEEQDTVVDHGQEEPDKDGGAKPPDGVLETDGDQEGDGGEDEREQYPGTQQDDQVQHQPGGEDAEEQHGDQDTDNEAGRERQAQSQVFPYEDRPSRKRKRQQQVDELLRIVIIQRPKQRPDQRGQDQHHVHQADDGFRQVVAEVEQAEGQQQEKQQVRIGPPAAAEIVKTVFQYLKHVPAAIKCWQWRIRGSCRYTCPSVLSPRPGNRPCPPAGKRPRRPFPRPGGPCGWSSTPPCPCFFRLTAFP